MSWVTVPFRVAGIYRHGQRSKTSRLQNATTLYVLRGNVLAATLTADPSVRLQHLRQSVFKLPVRRSPPIPILFVVCRSLIPPEETETFVHAHRTRLHDGVEENWCLRPSRCQGCEGNPWLGTSQALYAATSHLSDPIQQPLLLLTPHSSLAFGVEPFTLTCKPRLPGQCRKSWCLAQLLCYLFQYTPFPNRAFLGSLLSQPTLLNIALMFSVSKSSSWRFVDSCTELDHFSSAKCCLAITEDRRRSNWVARGT